MSDLTFNGIEILPEATPVKQLFILLHGVGASATDLVDLANKLKETLNKHSHDAALVHPSRNC